ncbi:hypothetical protein [Actinomyces wuliandei]|uniref:hypothetical protein n=1 Tax=Actinomyces wuliandei TaxID=2057743 RepID=UPI000FDA9640|nr:hypothetical protein [Actinomyces wuliandei]
MPRSTGHLDNKAARLIVRSHDREHCWATDNVALCAAIDAVFRYSLSMQETVYLSGAADPVSGRSWATVIMPPGTRLTASYSAGAHYDGDTLTAVAAAVRDQVERHGGVTLDADDNIIDQPDV